MVGIRNAGACKMLHLTSVEIGFWLLSLAPLWLRDALPSCWLHVLTVACHTLRLGFGLLLFPQTWHSLSFHLRAFYLWPVNKQGHLRWTHRRECGSLDPCYSLSGELLSHKAVSG